MAKKALLGRPKGPEKKPVNIYLPVDKVKKLKQRAKIEGRNISTIIERLLDGTLDQTTGTLNSGAVVIKEFRESIG